LKVWDWTTGRLQRDIDVFAVVEPFIKVNPQKRRHASWGKNDDDISVASSRGGRKRAGKTKRKDDSSVKSEDVETYAPSESANDTSNMAARVFVVRRIDSFLYEGEHHIVFSAVG
jgi:tRNA (guanine-N(7)-)-methyltransferase subunit TRM82